MPYHVLCGCYYVFESSRRYLPLVDLKSHTTVYSTASSTTLSQSFSNPSESQIKNLRYTFPLYDGVSVVDFKCQIRDKLIKGVVKEKDEAKATFKEAVARGETAGLLEQSDHSADVFSTELGNVPAQSKVVVTITYVGELKHDAEVDGVRFSIPTKIAPRYGGLELAKPSSTFDKQGRISITVDVALNTESSIQKLQSPSHPVSVSIGTLSVAPNDNPSFNKGHATLTLGSTELDKDFVLQICSKDAGKPFALLENHSSIPGYRALMASLVPKFPQKSKRPEIIFVVDRSGSMEDRMETVKTALTLLIKSCPAGVKFNICSFGSNHNFLWDKSQPYSETNVNKALKHVNGMSANFGGTETHRAMEATIKSRFKDLSTEVILLTDGQIYDQRRFFDYVREQVRESKGAIRVFPLGIGHGISSSLVEGVARAGNGFAQMVTDQEIMDTKVLRMLKGALAPHLENLTMEVKFADDSVTKITESLRLDLSVSDSTSAGASEKAKKSMSFYDTTSEDTTMTGTAENEHTDKYAHLPEVKPPKLLQAPAEIPPLFPFSRFTAFLLISPDAPSAEPVEVVIKGEDDEIAFNLPIPVEKLQQPGKMIHQLAVRKTCQELEEGAGWLTLARDGNGKLIKESHAGQFDQIVEREAVRLGVQSQVGGKFTSFVAVEANNESQVDDDDTWTELGASEWADDSDTEVYGSSIDAFVQQSQAQPAGAGDAQIHSAIHMARKSRRRVAPFVAPAQAMAAAGSRMRDAVVSAFPSTRGGGGSKKKVASQSSHPAPVYPSLSYFQESAYQPPSAPVYHSHSYQQSAYQPPSVQHAAMLGNAPPPPAPMDEEMEMSDDGTWPAPCPALAAKPPGFYEQLLNIDMSTVPPLPDEDSSDEDIAAPAPAPYQPIGKVVPSSRTNLPARKSTGGQPPRKQMASMPAAPSFDQIQALGQKEESPPLPTTNPTEPPTPNQLFTAILHAQAFDGSWPAAKFPPQCCHNGNLGLFDAAKSLNLPQVKENEKKACILATAVVVTYLQQRMPERAESLEFIIEKAQAFLETFLQGDAALEKEVWDKAKELVEGAPLL